VRNSSGIGGLLQKDALTGKIWKWERLENDLEGVVVKEVTEAGPTQEQLEWKSWSAPVFGSRDKSYAAKGVAPCHSPGRRR
jgi:hypothetical protein